MSKSIFLFALLTLLVTGCSSGDMGYVEGVVTLDGNPLPDATIEFYPKGSGGVSYGKTDASGYYELYLGRSGKGALTGEHLVQIRTGEAGGEYSAGAKEMVPTKYNNETELTATVNGGSNKLDFELKSEGKLVQPKSPRY